MQVTLRPLVEADFPMLHDWLNRPHVVEWWGGEDARPTLDELMQHYRPRVMAEEAVTPYIALLGSEPIGFAQSYVAMGSGDGWWAQETDPGVRGIDQFLANAAQLNQGLGTALVRALVRHLLADPAVTKIQTDPAPHNHRAIRCYERAGFVRQGIITTPDGLAEYMVHPREAVAGSPARAPRRGALLRGAVPGDARRIAQVLMASRRHFLPYAPSPHAPAETEAWVAQSLVPVGNAAGSVAGGMAGGVTVGLIDGEVVAVVAVSQRDGVAWIQQLVVLPGFEQRGIGAQLLQWAHAVLCRPIRLYTFQRNARARQFYERHGYRVLALSDGQGNEERCPDVLYELRA